MNYKRCYEILINSRQLLDRKKGEGIYYEKHHILPRCLGGDNSKENLILLTAKEHFIAHLLLIKCYEGKERNKMVQALWAMVSHKNMQRKISSRQYEFTRTLIKTKRTEEECKKMSISVKKRWENITDEERKRIGRKISEGKKGVVSPFKNKKLNEIVGEERASEIIKKIKENRPTKNKSYEEYFGEEKAIEIKNKIGNFFKGKTFDEERYNIHLLGVEKSKIKRLQNPYYHSEETKKLMSEQRLGKLTKEKNPMFGRCWIRNENENKVIRKEELEEYLINGWIKGRKQK